MRPSATSCKTLLLTVVMRAIHWVHVPILRIKKTSADFGVESKEKAKKVTRLMPKRQTLRYKGVAAFEMNNGRASSIMDDDCHLISAEALDGASMEIANDFDALLNI